MIFLTQINTYTEIMYSEIIQTHPPNVPHFDPAGILYLSSKASFSHNAIDISDMAPELLMLQPLPQKEPLLHSLDILLRR